MLSAFAIGFVALFLVLPLIIVFKEALADGFGKALDAIIEPDALAAVKLSLLVAGYRGAAQHRCSASAPPGPWPNSIFPARPFWSP